MDRAAGKFLAVAVLLCACATAQVAGQSLQVGKKGFGLSISVDKGNKAAPAPAPEAPKKPAPTPAPSAAPKAPAGTMGKFRKLSKEESIKARNNAKPGLNTPKVRPANSRASRGLLQSGPPAGQCPKTAAEGGRLTPSNEEVNCRIVSYYPSGTSGSCSAAKIGNDRLATAAHCIYDSEKGTLAEAVDVYCTGYDACSAERTTASVAGIISPGYLKESGGAVDWDLAVLRTADSLPGAAFPLAQTNTGATVKARTAGYPGQDTTEGQSGCESRTSCNQYSSSGDVQLNKEGTYVALNVKTCEGQSGSGVIDSEGRLIAVVAAGSVIQDGGRVCQDSHFAPNFMPGNVDGNCDNAAGGASLACLSQKLSE